MTIRKTIRSTIRRPYFDLVHPGSGLNPTIEVDNYIAGLTTPLSSGQVTKLKTFVLALKTGLSIKYLSDAFDMMKIYAGETAESSVKNLVKNAHHSTLVNSPTFTQFEGFTGNGISNYIEENWNGRTDGHAVAYTLNSASYGLYFRNFQRGVSKNHGVFSTDGDGGTSNVIMIGSSSDTNIFIGCNSTLSSPLDNNTTGFYIVNRAMQSIGYYRNKTYNMLYNDNPPTKIPDQSLVTLARRTTNTSVGLFNTSQVSLIFLGRALSQTDVNVITDAFEVYMDSNSKGVLS